MDMIPVLLPAVVLWNGGICIWLLWPPRRVDEHDRQEDES